MTTTERFTQHDRIWHTTPPTNPNTRPHTWWATHCDWEHINGRWVENIKAWEPIETRGQP